MNNNSLPKWSPDFTGISEIFEPLIPWAKKFSQFKNDWPALVDYQMMLDDLSTPILTHTGKTLKIVKQDGKPGHYSEHYAPRIYLSGEIQTRSENWHDFFQFLSWLMFPETKAVINSIHLPATLSRLEHGIDSGSRSKIENMLSLFDEGGAVILSSDESLLQLIRDFKWKELFWLRRAELESKLKLVTFGHGLYEKGLKPYIGMTANCILLKDTENILDLPASDQLTWFDKTLAHLIQEGKDYTKPRDLNPFPVLGLPGWDKNNELESFYDNQDYFRPGRRAYGA